MVIFDLDLDKCVACGACVIACMDQNDIWPDRGDKPFRTVGTLEPFPGCGRIGYFSIACMHCDDAPCVVGCPTGALFQNEETCFVGSDKSKCIGCHSCVMSCPFGAPKFDSDGKIEKCSGCSIRVENGLIPACVRICPTKALKYDAAENIEKGKKLRTLRKAVTV